MAKKKRADKKRLGVGAVCSVQSKFLHPGKLISDKYPNRPANHELKGLIVVEEGTKMIRKKDTDVILMRHEDFENQFIYCIKKWLKIETEGAQSMLFEESTPVAEVIPEKRVEGPTVDDDLIANEILKCGNQSDDIAFVRAQGLNVDDDNEPAPENIPVVGESTALVGQTWGWNGADHRKLFGAINHSPKIVDLQGVALEHV